MSLRKRPLSEAGGLKVKQIVDTFENLRFQQKKVCQIVNTFEKVILKVKKTHEFLKVACRKCDTFVTYFQKLKDVLTKTITLEGLRSGRRELRQHILQRGQSHFWGPPNNQDTLLTQAMLT